MDQDAFKRAVMESVVDRSLRDIRRDPRRGIRRLADLGGVAASGPYQKKFLAMVRRMLEQEDSPYYTMVCNAVQSADSERLKTFGINFGWNCLTVGTKKIRTREQSQTWSIPWSLTLHIGGGPDDLDAHILIRIIREGMELGIYTYFLFPDGMSRSISTALDAITASEDCAFFLFLPPEQTDAGAVQALTVPRNLMLGISSEAPQWQSLAAQLRQEGALYFLYRTYDGPDEARDIASGRWADALSPLAGISSICVAGQGCPAQCGSQVYRYARRSRMEQRYPTLVLDYYLDNLYADACISHAACLSGVCPNGELTRFQDGRECPTGLSVRSARLDEVLSQLPSRPLAPPHEDCCF